MRLPFAQVVASGVRVLLLLTVGLLGGMSNFGIVHGWRWALAWAGLFLTNEGYALYRKGSTSRALLNAVERVNEGTADIVDALAVQCQAGAAGSLREDQCYTLAVELLARVREYAAIGLNVQEDARMRVTLAVPAVSPDDGHTAGVRVWCYDPSATDRRRTFLPMGLPGAPRTFASGEAEIIPEANAALAECGIIGPPRRYKSVASIPVSLDRTHQRLAVVNIDVVPADFFTRDALDHRLLPLIAPLVTLLALVLVMRREDTPYAFTH